LSSIPARLPADPTKDVSRSTVPARARVELPADVIRAVRDGDPAAMSELFSWIRPPLVRYCRARITPRSGHGSADDVAQDICIAVLHGLPTFVGGPQEILRWVYGIAAHKVVDYYRRSGRDKSEPTERLPSREDSSAGPEELAMRGEQRAVVQSLLDMLSPTQREVLTLRVVVGLSSADTAAVTGLSASSVRVTQHRALNRLRRHLALDQGQPRKHRRE
jgi:RNA polymerase sigma-70 factor, ECF subfamily